jgi:RimJ/RimL family protein N-acetyltransferase
MQDRPRYSFDETLKDGTAVLVRSVQPDDGERIQKAFAQLERETIYTRFFGPKSKLSEKELATLTSVDLRRDAALLVTKRVDGEEIVIGSACYFSVADAPEPTAEIAFTVEEDYHGRGVATLLMKYLVHVAHENGIARFEADVLSQNRAMLAVFNNSTMPKKLRREGNVTHITFSLQGERDKG